MKKYLPGFILAVVALALVLGAVLAFSDTSKPSATKAKAPAVSKAPAAGTTCNTLSNGMKVCTTDPTVGRIAQTLVTCAGKYGPAKCVTLMLSAFKQDGASTVDADKLAQIVILKAEGKP